MSHAKRRAFFKSALRDFYLPVKYSSAPPLPAPSAMTTHLCTRLVFVPLKKSTISPGTQALLQRSSIIESQSVTPHSDILQVLQSLIEVNAVVDWPLNDVQDICDITWPNDANSHDRDSRIALSTLSDLEAHNFYDSHEFFFQYYAGATIVSAHWCSLCV